ncbi:MAG: thioesterase family protein [Candidatus Thiodiazotropha sp.]
MNLLFRLLRVIVAALFRSRIGLLDSSELRFRVLPLDLDINIHMTNARYLSFMDLGRTDLLLRAGMLKMVRREKWMPVVGHIDIKFRRPLSPFQRFSLKSRLLYWDKKWLYLEQKLESARGVHSVAIVRGLFIDRKGVAVPSQKLLDQMGYQGDSPPIPEEVQRRFA